MLPHLLCNKNGEGEQEGVSPPPRLPNKLQGFKGAEFQTIHKTTNPATTCTICTHTHPRLFFQIGWILSWQQWGWGGAGLPLPGTDPFHISLSQSYTLPMLITESSYLCQNNKSTSDCFLYCSRYWLAQIMHSPYNGQGWPK